MTSARNKIRRFLSNHNLARPDLFTAAGLRYLKRVAVDNPFFIDVPNNFVNEVGFCNGASCGHASVLSLYISAGSKHEFVEDCPKCGHPNVIHIEGDDEGDTRIITATSAFTSDV